MSTWGRNNGEQTPKKNWSLEEARGKLETFCAYQERCIWELRRKLFEKGIQGNAVDKILAELEASGFVDEERFARSFARGKFQIKGWGRIRITSELKQRQISPYCLRKAMEEIDPEAYLQKLEQQLRTRAEQYNNGPSNPFEIRQRLAQYGIRKGFEPEIVWETLKKIFVK